MKRFFISALLIMLTLHTMAQEFKSAQIGLIEKDGSYSLSFPSSTIVIDVIIEKEVVTPGVYARYAQKYLALRTPLAPKESYRIVTSSISLVENGENPSISAHPLFPATKEYIKLPIDQYSSSVLSADEAAREAANEIFSIRQHRKDLVSGDAGENYFGAGMQTAIEALNQNEAELLQLFTGTKDISQISKRYVVRPTDGTEQYIIARFSSTVGLVADTDLSGAPVYLQLSPMQAVDTKMIEAEPKSSNVMWFRIAAPTQCTLYSDSSVLSSTILSLYEFGKSIKVEVPRKR